VWHDARAVTYVNTYGKLLGNFWMQRDVISDYDTGDSWIYACDNQTGTTVCNCACEKLVPAGPCQDLNTSSWTFLGDDGSCDGTTPHLGCTKWAHLKSKAEDQEAYYWVTEKKPNELRHVKIYAPESLFNQSENVTDTRLGPPPSTTWEIPAVWQCVTPHGPVHCDNASSSSSSRNTVADAAAIARDLATARLAQSAQMSSQ
jgi:hypothetical protein